MKEIYDVYERNQLIFTGTARETIEKLHISHNVKINYYAYSGTLLQKRYIIKKHVEGKDPVLEHIRMHLKIYGNTFVLKDPISYIETLENEGIKIKITPYKSLDVMNKKKKIQCYLVEMV